MPWFRQPPMNNFFHVFLPINFLPDTNHPDVVEYENTKLWLAWFLIILSFGLVFAWGVVGRVTGSSWKPNWQLRFLRFGGRLLPHGILVPVVGNL